MTRRVAAIDCGTNSLRLLIADADRESHHLVDVRRRMEIVRLGQGVDSTGVLAPEALARTFRVLAEYAREIREADATRVRMVATSATRDARNAGDFTRGVLETLGIEPEVVSGGEEALLSFAGATTELAGPGADRDGIAGTAPAPPYLVVDIGGGSTEFVLGGADDCDLASDTSSLTAISVDIGSVRLTERHLHSDPPTAAELAALQDDVRENLATHVPVGVRAEPSIAIAVAGTPTQCAAIDLRLERYDPERVEGHVLTATRLKEQFADLASVPLEVRRRTRGLDPARAPVIVAGVAILLEVVECFGLDRVEASERDILWGLALSTTTDV